MRGEERAGEGGSRLACREIPEVYQVENLD